VLLGLGVGVVGEVHFLHTTPRTFGRLVGRLCHADLCSTHVAFERQTNPSQLAGGCRRRLCPTERCHHFDTDEVDHHEREHGDEDVDDLAHADSSSGCGCYLSLGTTVG